MKVRFDFSADTWIQGVEIEAESLEEAKEKLQSMTFDEIISNGYVKDFDISNIDVDIIEDDVTARIFNIEYSDPEDVGPEEIVVKTTTDNKDIFNDLLNAAEGKTSCLIDDFDYEIIEE